MTGCQMPETRCQMPDTICHMAYSIPPNGRNQWKLSWLLLVAFLLAVMPACKKQADPNEEEAAPNVEVEIATVEQSPIRQIVLATGTLNALPNRDVQVSALVAGRVINLSVIEGDKVSKGQELAQLDSSTYQDQLKRAEATLENAKQNENRLSKLFERGIAAGKEKEDAHKEFLIAQSEYDTAKIQVARTRITSPISGVVVKRFLNVGEQVDGTASQPIFEVGNFDPIELTATIQASLVQYVHEGEDAELKVDAFGNTVFPAKVVALLPKIDANTNTVTARIQTPNADHRLRGGMFATASIVAAVHPNALNIPASALVVANNEPKVFVVQADSTVQERSVKPGWRDGDQVEILEGVKSGERVVTTGSYGLGDKMKVTIVNKENST
jgi:membrane fusion protein (multidrug efflux system)